jgi:prepilin-type N-terminal cleavage/methylation domain-containing protein
MVTRARAGFTLLEIAVSLVVLGVVLTTVAQVIGWSAAEHRAIQRKRCALEAATTVLDCLSVRDWSAITSESAAAIHLPPETTRLLADPHLQVSVVEEKEQQGLPGKRVSVEITWANAAGRAKEQVRLSTWVFARGPLKGAAR